MNDQIPTISDAARSAIREHIIESEKRVDHPYLDIKGNVTIGVGFKAENGNEFAKLDLEIFKDGKWVPANKDEKRQAYRDMQAEKEKRGGDLNVNASEYEDKTNVRMRPPGPGRRAR